MPLFSEHPTPDDVAAPDGDVGDAVGRGGIGSAGAGLDDVGLADEDRRSPTVRVRAVASVVVVVALIVALLAVAFVPSGPSGNLLMTPGPIVDLTAAVASSEGPVTDAIGSDGRGRMLMTTVLARELDRLEQFDPRFEVPADAVIVETGPDTLRESERAGALRRIESEQAAARLAHEMTGNPVPALVGVQIVTVAAGSRAEAAGLAEGQVLTHIGGQQIVDLDRVDAATATVTVLHHGEVAVPEPSRSGEPLGVTLVEVRPSPFELDLSAVGGASGGLMLTLTMLDALSPGDLTAGTVVAGSGTVTADGVVGEVSGILAKAAAARDAGAAVMFVPAGSGGAAEVAATAGDTVEVVEVSRVADAVAWLCAAGASDELCT